jgi:hypothetical protein
MLFPHFVIRLLESSKNGVVSLLGVEVAVEQKRVTLGPPGVGVADTPDGNTDTVVLVQASLDDVGPVGLLGVLDVNLGERTLGGCCAERGHGSRGVGTLAGCQVTLGTDTVDGDTGGDPLLDVADQTLGLRVGGGVQAEMSLVSCR